MTEKSTTVMASHLGYLLNNPELMLTIYNRMKNFIMDNNIKPVIGKVFAFDQAAEAHEFIESRKSIGKVLLKL